MAIFGRSFPSKSFYGHGPIPEPPVPGGSANRYVVGGERNLVPQFFLTLNQGWSSAVGQAGAPPDTAVYGSEYSVTTQFAGFRAQPPRFDNPSIPSEVAPPPAVLWGDGYQPRAKHSSYRAGPPVLDNPPLRNAITWGDNYQPRAQHRSYRALPPYNDNPPLRNAILWGDGYQPTAQHRSYSALPPPFDNPVIGQPAAATAVFGDNFQFRRRFQQSQVSYARGAGGGQPEAPTNALYPSELWCTSQFPGYGVATSFSILGRGWGSVAFAQPVVTIAWGDGYQPRARISTYKAQPPRIDNPSIPQPAILWGDSYQPWAQHKSYKAREPFRDNPAFAFTEPPATAVWGDSYQVFNQFTGYRVATSFSILGYGWGSAPFIQAVPATAIYGGDYNPKWKFKFPNLAPGFLLHVSRSGSATGPPSTPAPSVGVMQARRRWHRRWTP